MIGPIANGAGIVLGSIAGALLGKKIHKNLRERLPLVFGCAAMSIGISMIVKVQTVPALILALLTGAIVGEVLHIENGIEHLAGKGKTLVDRILPGPQHGISHAEFSERFVAMLVLFGVSGMGIFGAMQEGMSGDPSLLIAKTFLDFFTAIIFATTLGFSLVLAVVPQMLVQVSLFFAASFIMPLTNEVMLADFSALGGVIMLATGFRMLGLVPFPISNMLPGLILIMPFSNLWNKFF